MRARAGAAVLPLLVVALALGLRLWMPGPTILTTDETNWSRRSDSFRTALAAGEYGDAVAAPRGVRATRPGVTTMWTGSLAIQIEGFDAHPDDIRRRAQQLMAVWCSLWLFPFMAAVRRISTGRVALIAGGLLAVEPLMVGHSRLLHTDALLTVTAGTALMALLAMFQALRSEQAPGHDGAWYRRSSLGWSVLAGVAAAFAMLTKLPAILLLAPVVVVAGLTHLAVTARSAGIDPGAWWTALKRAAPPVIGAGAAVVATGLVVWPALWVDPVEAISVSFEAARLAGDGRPRVFLGEVIVGGDWRYYPVAAYFRMSPWLLAGLAVAVVATIGRLVTGRPRLVGRRVALALEAYALPYLYLITISEKQYDRYLLPLLPVAAFALAVLIDAAVERYRAPRQAWIGVGCAILAAGLWTLSLAPYQISHVNPLVGGQQVAERNISLGWGEGLERFNPAELDGEPCESVWFQGPFRAFRSCDRVDTSWLDGEVPPPAMIGRYVFEAQISEDSPRVEEFLRDHGELVFTVEIGGVNYVEVWRTVPES